MNKEIVKGIRGLAAMGLVLAACEPPKTPVSPTVEPQANATEIALGSDNQLTISGGSIGNQTLYLDNDSARQILSQAGQVDIVVPLSDQPTQPGMDYSVATLQLHGYPVGDNDLPVQGSTPQEVSVVYPNREPITDVTPDQIFQWDGQRFQIGSPVVAPATEIIVTPTPAATSTPEATATPDLNTSNYERARQNVDNWLNGSIPLPNKFDRITSEGIFPEQFGLMKDALGNYEVPTPGTFNASLYQGIFLGAFNIEQSTLAVLGFTGRFQEKEEETVRFYGIFRVPETQDFNPFSLHISISPAAATSEQYFGGTHEYASEVLPMFPVGSNLLFSISYSEVENPWYKPDSDMQLQFPYAFSFATAMRNFAIDQDLETTISLSRDILSNQSLDINSINPYNLPVTYSFAVYKSGKLRNIADILSASCPGRPENYEEARAYVCDP